MWNLLATFLLVATIVTGNPNKIWNSNENYKYDVYTRTLTGIPNLKNQYVGLVTRGELVLQNTQQQQQDQKENDESNVRIIGKLHNLRYANFHDNLNENWEFEEIPDNQLQYQETKTNDKTFMLKFWKNGLIKSLIVDKYMENDNVNQLKGILSSLQINMNSLRQNDNKKYSHDPHTNSTLRTYKTMEPSVTGECETFYDVSTIQEYRLDDLNDWVPNDIRQRDEDERKKNHKNRNENGNDDYYQITKTINYENCDNDRQFHFGITGASNLRPTKNVWNKFLSKSTVNRIVANGNRNNFNIQYSTTTNVIEVSPELHQKNDKAVVVSQMIVVLKNHENIKTKLNEPNDPVNVGDLVYDYNIPTDVKNMVREKQHAHERRSSFSSSSSSSSSSESSLNHHNDRVRSLFRRSIRSSNENSEEWRRRMVREQLNEGINHIQNEKYQHPRRYNVHGDDSSSSSSSPSSSSSESREYSSPRVMETFQPQSTMRNPPEIPFMSYFNGNNGRYVQTSDNFNIEEQVRKSAKDIGEDLRNQNELPERNTLEKYNNLVNVVRTMTEQQMQNVAQQLYSPSTNAQENVSVQDLLNHEQLTWKTYRDAVAQAGTAPSVGAVSKWVSDEKVRGYEASEVLETVTRNVITPTEEVVKTLFRLIKSEQVRKQNVVYTAGLISLMNLLEKSNVNDCSSRNYYPVKSFGRFNRNLDNIVENEVLPYLKDQLDKNVEQKNNKNVVFYIYTIGKLGHPKILNIFEKYLNTKPQDDKQSDQQTDKYLTEFQRVSMVLALTKYTRMHPKTARNIHYKLYMNVEENSKIRSLAVLQLMNSKPTIEMLERIASSCQTETNNNLRSIVRSAILHASKLSDPDYEDLVEAASSARKFFEKNPHNNNNDDEDDNAEEYDIKSATRTHFRDYIMNEMNIIYTNHITLINDNDHSLPETVLVSNYRNFGGFKEKTFGLQMMLTSYDQLERFMKNHNDNDHRNNDDRNNKDNDNYDDDYDSVNNNNQNDKKSKWSIKNIIKNLNIERAHAKEIEGLIAMKFLGRKNFYSFDESELEKIVKQYMKTLQKENTNYQMNYNKLYNRQQIMIGFPLITGTSFVYELSKPQLIQMIGKINVSLKSGQTTKTRQSLLPNNVNVKTNVHFVMNTNHITKIGFIASFNRQNYLTGSIRKSQVHLPLDLNVNINFVKRSIDGQFNIIDKTKTSNLIHLSSTPYTVRHDVTTLESLMKQKNYKQIENQKREQYENYNFGHRTTGMYFNINLKHQIQLDEINFITYLLKQHNNYQNNPNYLNNIVNTVLNQPWHMKNLDKYKLNVNYDGQHTNNNVVRFSFNMENIFNDKSENNDHRKEQQQQDNDHHVDNEEHRRRRYDILRKMSNDYKQTDTKVYDIKWKFEGTQTTEYVLTCGHSNDQNNNNNNHYVVVMRKIDTTDDKHIKIDITTKYPTKRTRFNWKSLLDTDLKSIVNIKMEINNNDEKSNGKKTDVNIDIQMKQTNDYKTYVRNSNDAKRCDQHQHDDQQQQKGRKQSKTVLQQAIRSCLNIVKRSQQYDRIEFNVNYHNLNDHVRNLTYKIFSEFRHRNYWNSDENINNKRNSNENRLTGEIQISPNRRTFNVNIQDHEIRHNFVNINLNNWVQRSLLLTHSDYRHNNNNNDNHNNVCVYDKTLLKTFDNAIIRDNDNNNNNCWLTMLQYTAKRTKYGRNQHSDKSDAVTILVRNVDTKEKSVKILIEQDQSNTDHIIDLTKSQKHGINIVYNDNKQFNENRNNNDNIINFNDKDDTVNDYPAIQITKMNDNEIMVNVRDGKVRVYYDGETVRVDTDPIYRNNVRGLCGNYNDEQIDDLLKPNKCFARSDKDYLVQWAIVNDQHNNYECSANVEKQRKTTTEQKCERYEYVARNVIDEDDLERNERNSQRNEDKRKNHQRNHDNRPYNSQEEDRRYKQRYNNNKHDYQRTERNSNERNSNERNSNERDSKERNSKERNSNERNSNERNSNEPNSNERYSKERDTQSSTECNLREQTQYAESKNQVCFSVRPLPACPKHCVSKQKQRLPIQVHCRDSSDSVAQMYKTHIRNGANPDFSDKPVTKSVTFNVPQVCVPAN